MRRVYKEAKPVAMAGGHGVTLDGKLIKTPGKRDLLVPSAILAAAIAEEWDSQQDEVRPTKMPLTRLAATCIDRVAPDRGAIIRQTANYAGTDLVCYRAARPPALTARQQAVWQPLIDWAVLRYDAPLTITTGVVPKSQTESTLRAFAAAVAERNDFELTALHVVTAACGSLVIGLALIEGRLGAQEAFAASQLDESFQIEGWGEDAEQAERRRALAADIEAATRFLLLLRA
ncbi:MAG: ATP12 family chaperone protein [Stellaceae bacterium]|jgi:chaperone required for assembly of F1-ATPase